MPSGTVGGMFLSRRVMCISPYYQVETNTTQPVVGYISLANINKDSHKVHLFNILVSNGIQKNDNIHI